MQVFDNIGSQLALVAKTTIEAVLKGNTPTYNKQQLYRVWAQSSIMQIFAITYNPDAKGRCGTKGGSVVKD